MSLFGGLFGGGTSLSSLFSEASEFKVGQQLQQTAAASADQPGAATMGKKRKDYRQAAAKGGQPEADDPAAKRLAAGIAAATVAHDAAGCSGGKSKAQQIVEAQENPGKKKQRPKQATVQMQHPGGSSSEAVTEAADDTGTKPKRKKLQHQQKQQKQQVREGSKQQHNITPAVKQGAAAAAAATDSNADSDAPEAAAAAGPDPDSESDAEQLAAAAAAGAGQRQQQCSKPELDPAAAAEKLCRTVFVGNLPVSIKRKALKRLFGAYGTVDSVRLRSVPIDLDSKQKMPRRAAVIKGVVSSDRGGANAYVVLKGPAAAEAALAANMTEVEGHHIRVDRAAPPASAAAAADSVGSAGVLYDPTRSVFVGNLDFKVSEEELISAFSNAEAQCELAGAVEAVRVVRDPKTNLGKGIGYVLFRSKAAARAALQLNGSQLRERAMRVSRVDRKAAGLNTAAAKAKHMGGGRGVAASGRPAGKAGPGRLGGKPGNALGVRQGGVQKQRAEVAGSGAAASAGWQGLRTKGKGSGFRAAKSSKAGGGAGGGGGAAAAAAATGRGRGAGGSKGFGGVGRAAGGRKVAAAGGKAKGKAAGGNKRPAVAARKAAAKAAAKRGSSSK